MSATANGRVAAWPSEWDNSISAASNFGSCCEPHASGSLLKTSRHPLPTRFSHTPYDPGKPTTWFPVAITVFPNRRGRSILNRGPTEGQS